MMQVIKRMQQLLERRKQQDAFRSLQLNDNKIDFCSNDYLSIAGNRQLTTQIHQQSASLKLGSTGSRLLSGHYELLEKLEIKAAQFHHAQSALLFNSGYAANLSVLSAIPRKSDVILYDALIHASLHDGLKLSVAHAESFEHNNLRALEQKLSKHSGKNIFVVVESVYSMDGDETPLADVVELCQQYQALLIVDEAHSTGIYGEKGAGFCVEKKVEDAVFARIHTFGKAFGLHAAVIVGTPILKDYLINFARPLIYTTAVNPHTALSIYEVYKHMEINADAYIKELRSRIDFFKSCCLPLHQHLIPSNSPIQGLLVPGNEAVVKLCAQLQHEGFDVRAIRSPTVAAGQERIRICLHRHNTETQIRSMADALIQGLKHH